MDLEKIAAPMKEIREYDRIFIEEMGIPGVVLMENAGRGAANIIIMKYWDKKSAAVVCGKGNNGGDGYVVARHLTCTGFSVDVYIFAKEEEIRGDAKINLDIIRKMGLSIKDAGQWSPDDLESHDIIIDGLLGTGITGSLRDDFRDLIDAMNRLGCPIIALDIPSGMNGDTGEIFGAAIKAERTITFALPKIGFFKGDAKKYTGEIHLVDIGITPAVIKRKI